jgi:hypothetical protein
MKGALRCHSSVAELRRVVRFQLNPESLRRKQATSDGRRLVETLALELPLHLAAEDDVGNRDQANGIYPLLAALEELFAVQANPPTGNLFEILSGNRPWVFLGLEWGARRIPVRIEALDITEHRFLANLAPCHATVQLELRVLRREETDAVPTARSMLDNYLERRARSARWN